MFESHLNLMRINRPIGVFLLLWPTLWALWFANGGSPSLELLIIFSLGCFCMRSAGCIINDFIDLKFDSKVTRTRNRALVKGEVAKSSALLVLFGLLVASLILVSRLNWLALKVSAFALVLTTIYPFVKRYTGMVQLFLGITFALGIPMAFAATNNYIGIYGWSLYGINIVWIVAFDTIYAMLDKADDLKIGINSSAILLGNFDKRFVLLLQGIVYTSLAFLGSILEFGIWYHIFIAFTLGLFVYQYRLMQSGNYMLAFVNNNLVGVLIFLGFVFADYSKAY